MLFRGREMMHLDHGFELMNEIAETLQESGKTERAAQKLGRRITMVMGPLKV
jgi:translation initiation factor IF-3